MLTPYQALVAIQLSPDGVAICDDWKYSIGVDDSPVADSLTDDEDYRLCSGDWGEPVKTHHFWVDPDEEPFGP